MGRLYFVVRNFTNKTKFLYNSLDELKNSNEIFANLKNRNLALSGSLVDNKSLRSFSSKKLATEDYNKNDMDLVSLDNVNPVLKSNPIYDITKPYKFYELDLDIMNPTNDKIRYILNLDSVRSKFYSDSKNKGNKFLIKIRYIGANNAISYRTFDLSLNSDFDAFKEKMLSDDGGGVSTIYDSVQGYEAALDAHADLSFIGGFYNVAPSVASNVKVNKYKMPAEENYDFKINVIDPEISSNKNRMTNECCFFKLLRFNFNSKRYEDIIKSLESKYVLSKGIDSVVLLTDSFIREVEDSLCFNLNIISDYDYYNEDFFDGDDNVTHSEYVFSPNYLYESDKRFSNSLCISFLLVDIENAFVGHIVQLEPDKIGEVRFYYDKKDDVVSLIDKINNVDYTLNYLFYDYETVYCTKTRRHIPVIISVFDVTEDELIKFGDGNQYDYDDRVYRFEGSDCTKKMIKFFEDKYPVGIRKYIGFNSSRFDIYFVISCLINELDKTPNLIVFKDKIYCEDALNIFLDIKPLLPVGSLASLCGQFKTVLRKLKGDISFNYMNDVFNDPYKGKNDINQFLNYLHYDKYTPDNSRNVYDVWFNYCDMDVKCLGELYYVVRSSLCKLLNSALDSDYNDKDNKYIFNSKYFSFDNYKTIGQLSISLLLTINKYKGKSFASLIKKSKNEQYDYFAKVEYSLYPELRKAIIASISYSKNGYNNSDDDFSVVDVVSLYPFVMASSTALYGCGNLTLKSYNCELRDDMLDSLKFGIYKVVLTYHKEKFQRIPYKPKNFAYQWVHKAEKYECTLYLQDLLSTFIFDDVTIEIKDCYEFDKVCSGKDIFGNYVRIFSKEKNLQDYNSKANVKEYSPGIRELCKAMMNVVSGKCVQRYNYDKSLKIDSSRSSSRIIPSTEYSSLGDIRIYEVENKINPKKIINCFDLVSGQLYCHSRAHMFENCVDPVYKLGYEPIVIETDSLVAHKAYFDLHMVSNKMIKNVDGKDISLYYNPKDGLKEFGQLEVEYKDVKNVKVYMKKSYCYNHELKDGKTFKYRFKGISQGCSVLLNSYDKRIYLYLNVLLSYVDNCRSRNLLNDSLLIRFNDVYYNVFKYFFNKKQIGSDSFGIESNCKEFFDKMINKDKVTIIQDVIKKNLLTKGRKDGLTLQNLLVVKTFNKERDAKGNVINDDFTKKISKANKINECFKFLESIDVSNVTINQID